ncbi:uncharacterized protein angptl8 isoform X2 [Synchiropus splendidus]|uniref:uncharacterized protein angptl8 isoform X2 n=1 Tax=Synchiropus splendidus TaxID=270530 RepID=UPI00237E15F3|nr:uncharacterized protein angptl8 isoform X2 [Synchiropus splendidus]
MMSLTLFLLLGISVLKGIDSTWISSKTEDKPAPLEEINILMFGALQFSNSLKLAYESTDAKIAKITSTLNNREGALLELMKQTEQALEEERQMKSAMRLLRAQMDKQYAQAKLTKDWLAEFDNVEAELRQKVKRMEAHLNSISPGRLKELQERAAENAIILKGLQDLTQFQRQNIESHDQQLGILEKLAEAA